MRMSLQGGDAAADSPLKALDEAINAAAALGGDTAGAARRQAFRRAYLEAEYAVLLLKLSAHEDGAVPYDASLEKLPIGELVSKLRAGLATARNEYGTDKVAALGEARSGRDAAAAALHRLNLESRRRK